MSTPVGIVAGSGITLDSLLDETTATYPFSAFPGLSCTTVEGHASRFTVGTCDARPIVLQCGRLHCYEGLTCEEVTRTIDVLKDLGVRTLLFTNATGGLRPEMTPGSLVAVDRIRLWPYQAWPSAPETLLPDFVPPYCDFTGTYQWMHGPCYETRAEINALQQTGAEVVGMSAAPEIVRCNELGIPAGLISCVTNSCCQHHPLTHTDVIRAAHVASGRLTAIIRRLLPEISPQKEECHKLRSARQCPPIDKHRPGEPR